MTDHVFVYGTLRRGQCRQDLWPCRPLQVTVAFVRGRLYDLGPYPALLPGDDFVRGECWTLRHEDVDETLRVLDEIEEYAQPGAADLYRRQVVDVFGSPRGDAPPALRGHAYFLVAERLPLDARRMMPSPQASASNGPDVLAYASWPEAGRTAAETSSLADPFDPVA